MAILTGIGGLGHLAIQFANRMGFKAMVIGRGNEKKAMVKRLWGCIALTDNVQNAVEEPIRYGEEGMGRWMWRRKGDTCNSARWKGDNLGSWVGLSTEDWVISASDELLVVSPTLLLSKRLSITGWPSDPSHRLSGHARLQHAFWCEVHA